MTALFWPILLLACGGCIGSFLNVVVYRWPRGLSVQHPARSFCPRCGAGIAWYDNIPVLSYLLLRGRCRKCHASISVQYPLVELATALTFVLTYDTFFVAHERMGIPSTGALTELLAENWPILAAHCLLWAGMIALAVMDLEAYEVDIRITWILGGIGLLAHALWTPASSFRPDSSWLRPGPEGAALAVGASVGLVIGAVLFLRQGHGVLETDAAADGGREAPSSQDTARPREADASSPSAKGAAAKSSAAPKRSGWQWLLIPAALIVIYMVALQRMGPGPGVRDNLVLTEYGQREFRPQPLSGGELRLAMGLGALFVGLVAAASQPRVEADAQIVEEIQAGAEDARGMAIWELKVISPAVLLGVGALVLMHVSPAARAALSSAMHWRAAGDWQPLWGLATGLFGWVMAGALAWVARIFFTLVFGKEALGMGDVHILAAAGAIAGWPVALLGFFLAAPLALLGVVVIQLRRQSRALPYGPWLALAFLLAAIFQDRILIYLGVRWMLVGNAA
jgi:prepilin signal peptidase PulO-like enzyme (type II secretory pathway)